MPTYAYTGTLTDIGLGVLTGKSPRMWVRPEREAVGPDGLVSRAPVEVVVNPVTGAFTLNLVASSDLQPPTKYVIEVTRFESAYDGSKPFVGGDLWRFFASPGGGPISEQDGSPFAIFYGPPWPEGEPAGMYINNQPPFEWGIKEN